MNLKFLNVEKSCFNNVLQIEDQLGGIVQINLNECYELAYKLNEELRRDYQ